jgi:hypothetical protein
MMSKSPGPPSLVNFLAPHKVSAFVNDGSGRQAADQRDVMIFVIIDQILHFHALSLGEKAKYLEHGATPFVARVFDPA